MHRMWSEPYLTNTFKELLPLDEVSQGDGARQSDNWRAIDNPRYENIKTLAMSGNLCIGLAVNKGNHGCYKYVML